MSGVLYTAGRTIAYVGLAVILVMSLQKITQLMKVVTVLFKTVTFGLILLMQTCMSITHQTLVVVVNGLTLVSQVHKVLQVLLVHKVQKVQTVVLPIHLVLHFRWMLMTTFQLI